MSFCRLPLTAAAVSLLFFSGAVGATEYIIRDTVNDGSDIVVDVIADDGICSLGEAFQAIADQEDYLDCDAGTGADKILLEEGKTYQVEGELIVGGGIRELDINGDLDYDDAFLAPQVDEGEPVPDPSLPVVDGELSEAEAGTDFNRDGDMVDTFVATLFESVTVTLSPPGLNYNADRGDTDYSDTFTDVFYEKQFIDEDNGNAGIDINGDGIRDGLFDVIREFSPQDINVNVVIRVEREPLDDDPKVNPVIIAASSERIFNVKPGNSLSIEGITLAGSGAVTGDGGLVYNEGTFKATGASVLQDGGADNGGAIYQAGDQASINLDNVTLLNNVATVNGGVVGTSGTFTGVVSATRLYATGNSAVQGGVVYLGGTAPRLAIVNSTFFGNTANAGGGAAFRFVGPDRATVLSNITIAGNDGGSGVSFGTVNQVDSDVIINSVIVGNVGGSCYDDDAGGQNKADAHIAYLVHDASVAAAACPADVVGLIDTGVNPGDVTSNLDDQGSFVLLRGVRTSDGTEGVCPDVTGSADCTPLVRGNTDDVEAWTGFLPAITSPGVAPTLIDSGAPVEDISNICTAKDQRDIDRETDCDPGAVELRIAKGLIDEFIVVQGVSELVDPTENDRGDLEIDCSLPGVVNCMVIDILPSKGTALVEIGADNIPRIRYQSGRSVHGVDSLHYIVEQEAIVGGRTYAGSDIGAEVRFVVEPASGLTDADSIGGALGVFSLLLVMAGFARRKKVFIALLVLMASSSQAATITVTSLEDNVTVDGFCTLREAIRNVTDDAQLPSPDCEFGAEGRDVVQVPAGTINLTSALDVPEDTLIEIIGAGAHLDLEGQPAGNATIIRGAGDHRLIVARSSMNIFNLTLENGNAGANDGGAIFSSAGLFLDRVLVRSNQARSGGAIYLNYQSGVKRSVKIESSQFSGNSATLNGGVLSMVGANQDQTLFIDATTFEGNTAAQFGGALDVNLTGSASFSVTNSTFDANNALVAGDAIDLGDVSGVAYIISSAFTNQDAAIDLRDAPLNAYMSNSVYLYGSGSGTCTTGATAFHSINNTVFGASISPSCVATDNNDSVTSQTPSDLMTVLGNTMVAAAGEGDEFIPAHYVINTASPNDVWLLDQGNGDPDKLVSGFGSPGFCRKEDLRGVPRTAGGSCDIGPYELQVATAVEDSGSNNGKRGQYAIIDVLANDVTGENDYMVPYAIDLEITGPGDTSVNRGPIVAPGSDGGTVYLVRKELDEDGNIIADPQTPCGGSVINNPTRDPDEPLEECVIRYEARTAPPLTCEELKDYEDTFEYTFMVDTDPDITGDPLNVSPSLTGTVTVSIANVGPKADNVTIRAEKGEVVVFPFVPDDPDTDGTPLSNFELIQKPVNAKFDVVDGKRIFLGAGIVVDTTAGTLTYYPDNVASPFDDSFVLRYEDECGGAGTTRFTVDLPVEENSGDFVGGGLGYGVLLLWSTLLMRRRRN